MWNGEEILRLAGPTDDSNRGADVASHPSVDRQSPVVVNATDEERARIVRRYRLMSYQPDEWNTLKALSEMKPGEGNFDPKLYQYGGLWVYPVGALLKAASMLHLVELRSDMAWYLDHPAAFSRFYIVARLWSVTWAMIGVVAIFILIRRIVGGTIFPAIASLCFIFMPVVVNMAHEAKPHLAGAVLITLAVLAASRYVERGTRAAWMSAGGFAARRWEWSFPRCRSFSFCRQWCCCAVRPGGRKSSCAAAMAIGVLVYGVTNPYVPDQLRAKRRAGIELRKLQGDVPRPIHPGGTGKRLAISWRPGRRPSWRWPGRLGTLALGFAPCAVRARAGSRRKSRRRSTGLLLAIPAMCVMGQCLLFATGKPGEFAIPAAGGCLPGCGSDRCRRHVLASRFVMQGPHRGPRFSRPLKRRPRCGPHAKLRRAGYLICLLLVFTTAIPGFRYIRAISRATAGRSRRGLSRPPGCSGSNHAGARTIGDLCRPPRRIACRQLIFFASGSF